MREDAFQIIQKTIADCLPDKAVRDSLQKLDFTGKGLRGRHREGRMGYGQKRLLFFWLTGWKRGIIITKYEHSRGALDKFEIIEAGIPRRMKIPFWALGRLWSW